jgi:hypothetical protein
VLRRVDDGRRSAWEGGMRAEALATEHFEEM